MNSIPNNQNNNLDNHLINCLDKAEEYICLESKHGFLPYLPGQNPTIESSVWGALSMLSRKNYIIDFFQSLLSYQNKDGGWSNQPGLLGSDWSSSIAAFALKIIAKEYPDFEPVALKSAYQKATQWLLENRSEYYSNSARFALLIWRGPQYDYPHGWPWTPNTFDWVEPTSYALLSLQNKNNSSHIEKILKNAEKYLFKVSCPNGGWNFGDKTPFGEPEPADPHSTALVLLSLKSRCPEDLHIQKSLAWLKEKQAKFSSIHQIAWCSLALSTYNYTENILEFAISKQNDNGSFCQNLLTHTIMTLSLKTLNNPSYLV